MNIESLWEQTCVLLSRDMPFVSYSTWVEGNMVPGILEDDTLFITVKMMISMIQNKYASLIERRLSEVAGKPMQIVLLTKEEMEARTANNGSVKTQDDNDPHLNPKYTFDTFVVGANNRFAHAASLAVAESPGTNYNPLFIYGGVGLGKTHLMHAIGHYILSQNPEARVKYMTTEAFTNEMITAIQTRTMSEFKEKYRNNVDVLMVDDIQFLAGRDATQEEFFHTFNSLRENRKQIIISSDKPPREIPRLEERLRSRFEGGLIADISRPDEETRYEILRRKAEDEPINVPPEVLHMIAERISSNIRELEGAMTRLIAYASLTGRQVDRELAETALRETFAASEKRRVSCDDVIRATADYFNIRWEDLKGPRRSRDIAVPRQMSMFLCREMVGVSLEMIGRAFNRDHTTVMHACQKVTADLKTDPQTAQAVDDLKKKLTENG